MDVDIVGCAGDTVLTERVGQPVAPAGAGDPESRLEGSPGLLR
jgi:hypothetical protein